MRINLVSVSVIIAFLLIGGRAYAQDIKPARQKIEINDNKILATFDALKVRVNQKDDEFFSHKCFITIEDAQKLAKLRSVSFACDAPGKKLAIADKKYELIPVDPKSEDSFFFGKARFTNYKGKVYLCMWDIYGGYGFESISQMTDGVFLYDAELDKKKK